jgi:hypothetical protein
MKEIEWTICKNCGQPVQDTGRIVYEVDRRGRRMDIEHECNS